MNFEYSHVLWIAGMIGHRLCLIFFRIPYKRRSVLCHEFRTISGIWTVSIAHISGEYQ